MKKAWPVIFPILILVFFWYHSGNSNSGYIDEIEAFRQEKADFYRTSKGSPFVEKGVEFPGLDYFPPNPDFKVNVTLERLSKRETLRLTNSDGSVTTYLKYAIANFNLQDKDCQLLILKALGFGNQYLLAFGDDTSGESTYGGGRYLDVVVGKSDQLTLDFNKAYNPYCAYFADYTCPLPPKENLLEVAIEAGEKNYLY